MPASRAAPRPPAPEFEPDEANPDVLRWSALLAHWSAGAGPRYARLARALRGRVEDGHLRAAERLPSERVLAELLGLSRSTVVAAYDDLAADGWLERRRGSGTRVSAAAPRRAEVLALRSPLRGPAETPGELDFTVAVPDLGPEARERLRRATRAAADAALDPHYHPLGWPDLRALLAEIYTREGLPTTPEQVVVTTGAQQAIALAAQVFLRRGDRAVLETPTYFGAIDVFRAAGASLLGVPVRGAPEGGVRPDDVTAALREGPRLAFLTPTYQNPTGGVLPLGARERLARALQGADVPLVEDDTLVDLGFDDTPIPPRLSALAPDAPVLNVGSLSKLFWAGLRVGWLRVPRALAAEVRQAKTLQDFGTSLPSQVIAHALLADLDALRAERRAAVRPARDALAALLREHLPEWTFSVPDGGQFLWVRLPTRHATGFTHAARPFGVRLFPGASMGVGDLPDRFVRLPFTLPPEHLPEAVRRLRLAWDAFAARDTGRLA